MRETMPGSESAAEAAREAALLVDLAIRRARGNPFVGEEVKESLCRLLEDAKEEILLIGVSTDRVDLEVVQGDKGSLEVSEERGWQEEKARKRGHRHAGQPS